MTYGYHDRFVDEEPEDAMTNKRAPIVRVELSGFKGRSRVFVLSKLTLLTGNNGLGKSAVLEAIKWCLTGVVPSGKTKDEAAKFFDVRGGFVKLTDGDGNWLKRTLTVDHQTKRVSTDVESHNYSSLKGEASRASDFWRVNEVALEIGNFLELSSSKRREFILKLVSQSELPPLDDVLFQVGTTYAKLVAGDAATIQTLEAEQREDLSEETAALAERFWQAWSVLKTFHGGDGARFWLNISKGANDAKLFARRSAVEANAAIKELEAEVRGARAAAARVEALKVEAENMRDDVLELESRAALRQEKLRALDSCTAERDASKQDREAVLKSLDELGALGDRPDGPEDGFDDATLSLQDLVDKQAELEDETALDELRVYIIECAEAKRHASDELVAIRNEPIGRLLDYVESHTDPNRNPELRELVDEVASGWRGRLLTASSALDARIAEMEKATKQLHGRPVECTKRREFLQQEVSDASERFADAKQRWLQGRGERHSAIDTWHAKKQQIALYNERLASAEKRLKGLSPRVRDLETELKGFAEVEADEMRKLALKAEFEYKQALKAAGAVLAYERATQRAKDQKVEEKSWALCWIAIQRAREVLVAEIVTPIVGDIQALLARAGRKEQVYLLLENERGVPIFDLGWIDQESRRSLDALSGGEAVLFVTALALSIAKRIDDRKLLLIEADPLDEGNLEKFLLALALMDLDLDACIVATSTQVDRCVGWRVLAFLATGEVKEVQRPLATKVRLKKSAKKKAKKA